MGEPILTDASQIYANNWSVNEGAELKNLIDGDKNTFWVTTWEDGAEQTPSEPSSLRFYSEAGFPDTVQVQYAMRQNESYHRVPANMRVQVSNDAETWITLPSTLTVDDLGGTALLSKYHTDSLTYIVSGIGGYKYVRFEVFNSINQGGGDWYNYNVHALYEFSEFNLYNVTGVNENSYILQPSHKGVAFELFNAIQAAKAENNSGKATQATYDKLVAAVEAFKTLSTNDSTIAIARYNVENLTAGDRIGEFPQEDLDAYTTKVSALLEEYDNATGTVSSDKMKELVGGLKDAYSALYDKMIKPEGKWYVISTANANRQGMVLYAGGAHTHAFGNGYSYWLTNAYPAGAYESYSHWTLTKDKDGRYIPQNVGQGGFFGPYTGSGNDTYNYRPICWYEPKAFTIVPFGEGQVGFLSAEGYYVKNTGSWYAAGLEYFKADGSATAFKNTALAWTIDASEEAHGEFTTEPYYSKCANHRVIAITMPYEYTSPAQAVNDADKIVEDIYPYQLVGKVTTNEGDSIITAYKLQMMDEIETVKGGTPVIYIMPGEKFDANVTSTITFSPVMNTPVSAEVDTINGLMSVPATWYTTEAHLGYFLEDSVVDEPKGTTIGYQRAVILPNLVKNLVSDEEVDAIVYVKGAGMLNGINNAEIIAIKKFVNVYTTDGVLVRKHVDEAKATEGLKKGVYVVGNKKVLVK